MEAVVAVEVLQARFLRVAIQADQNAIPIPLLAHVMQEGIFEGGRV
jgi:hypothetical protein